MEPHPTNQNVHGGTCTLNVDKKLVDRAKVHIYASQMKIFISATTCEYQTCNIVITQKDMNIQRFGRYKKLRIRRVSQDFQDVVFLMIIWVSYKNKNRTPVNSSQLIPFPYLYWYLLGWLLYALKIKKVLKLIFHHRWKCFCILKSHPPKNWRYSSATSANESLILLENEWCVEDNNCSLN